MSTRAMPTRWFNPRGLTVHRSVVPPKTDAPVSATPVGPLRTVPPLTQEPPAPADTGPTARRPTAGSAH